MTLWWGERDVVCPPSIARVFEERLPDATLRLTDDTHQILFSRWRELLADAARPATSEVMSQRDLCAVDMTVMSGDCPRT